MTAIAPAPAPKPAFRTRTRVKGTKLYVGMSADPFLLGAGGSGPAYVAGSGSGYRAANWFPSRFGPNAALAYNLQTMRNRALHEDRNNPVAGGAHDKIAAQIVGVGIKPQSLCPDIKTREAINQLFADWTDEADADGMFDFYGQQWIAARSVATQGEMFARFRVRRPGDMETVPLQMQLLEADFCPLDFTRPADQPGNVIRDGIETDLIGRRAAYWMYRYHPGDAMVFNQAQVNLLPVRVPATEVAHVYLPYRIGQMRGAPWLARALAPLRDLAEYQDAERVRKKIAALFAGFIKSDESADAPLADATSVAGDDDIATLEPGTMQRLKPGEDVTFSSPAEVGNTYDPFLTSSYREIAAGVGLLYEQLTGDYSKLNDRTLRAALLDFRRTCNVWQHHMMVFQLSRQLWSRWIVLAELAGRLARPAGMSDADFRRVRHVPEAWPYIHPVQEVQGKLLEINGGLKSRSETVSASGGDAEQVDRENAADQERAKTLGVVYQTAPAAAAGKDTTETADPAAAQETANA